MTRKLWRSVCKAFIGGNGEIRLPSDMPFLRFCEAFTPSLDASFAGPIYVQERPSRGKGRGYLSRLNVGEKVPHFVFQAFCLDGERIGQRLDVGGGRARAHCGAGDAAD